MSGKEPLSLLALIAALERLPSIGARTASRLAHHLLRVPEAEALELADAIRTVREMIRPCNRCRAPSDQNPCPICSDETRDASMLLVLETARDLIALEKASHYKGLYFVLGDRLRPIDGVDVQALELNKLRARASDGVVREVCVGTNPDLEGDGAALSVLGVLEGLELDVTQLARGLPSGGQIEYQSATAIADAFDARVRVMDPD